MSDTFRPRRTRLASALAVLLSAAAVTLLLVLSHTGVPDAWWPQTGNAFPHTATAGTAPSAEPAPTQASPKPKPEDDPCDLIVGPAHAYCVEGRDNAGPPSGFTPAAALLLTPAVIGVVVIRYLARRKA
ncbi:hypothetical protein QIS99_28280 [Streptomyces sp. B-S-A8]|uniref:Uncharacterized protein n=1 Tax=Streptomyces solicavernae TaxID=3043614 RepID=A0ABT6S0F7_9ACTN|nr:hypothetical protein [Streptomyces sp. B-S-A8]MDI3390060.1 hypothetical protein [Streptomyces sp. B-S-A8]